MTTLLLTTSCQSQICPDWIENTITGRFNERLVLSLASNPACIFMDDELNILPTSRHVAAIAPLPRDDNGGVILPAGNVQGKADLVDLIKSLADTQVRSHRNSQSYARDNRVESLSCRA